MSCGGGVLCCSVKCISALPHLSLQVCAMLDAKWLTAKGVGDVHAFKLVLAGEHSSFRNVLFALRNHKGLFADATHYLRALPEGARPCVSICVYV